VFTSTA